MPIDFPSAPTTNQTYTYSGKSWVYNGSAWVGNAPAVSSVMTGIIEMYAGATAPTGYLLCDGSAVSRTTYAALFAVTGTTYGSGDGSTTFNLPDLRGRLPMGAGTGVGLNSSGTGAPSGTAQTARTRGQWLGEETHQLTTTEMPIHNHGGITGYMDANAAHGHLQANKQGTSGGQYGLVDSSNSGSSGQPYTATVNTDHRHSISNSGSDGRHATIPPVIVVNYIIKT